MNESPTSTSLIPRLTRAQALLAFGDMLAFIFFSALGHAAHNLSLGQSPVLTVIEVAAPFAIVWYIVAALFGVYRIDVLTRPRQLLARTFAAWLIAGPTGLILRSILLQRLVALPFAIIALSMIAALLLLWRLLFSFIAAR